MADYSVGSAYLTILPDLSGFGENVRRQLAEEDFSATVPLEPELNSEELDARIAEIKARLDELSGGDVTISVDDADALAEMEVLKAELDELEAKRATITARADTGEAKAELDELRADADELDGKTVTIHAKADTSDATNDINKLMLAGVALGPALIPIAAAAAGGLGAIGIGAIGAVAGLGVLKEAFSGVGTAISAVESQQTKQGTTAAQTAAQQISSANSIANAQDSLRTAVENVGVAEETAARNVASAVEQQQQAEQSLSDAIRSQTQAQEALTQARIDAQNALVNSTLSVQDNALAQRSAQLQLEQAQQNLAQLSPSATQLQRDQAQLAVAQAQQQITDTIAQGKQLQQQNATLQAQGVEGSSQVVSAQNSITSANEQVANAQQKVADSTAAVAQAQEDGARQIAQSQQAVVTATRALQDAQAQQAAQAAAAANANNAAAQAMANLSPAAQSFVNFIVGLKPQLDQLKQSASDGILTGLQAGIQAVLPDLPLLNSLISSISTALGDLFKQAGQALASPYWTGFISFIQSQAAPSIQTFGVIIGNLAHGFAGLLEAFAPVWTQMGQGLEHLTADFANFGATASSNQGFQNFLAYVEKEGPVVVHTIGDLIAAFGHIGQALGPLGGVILTVVDDLAKFVSAIPTPILTPIVTALYLGYLGWKSWQIIDNVTTSIGKFVEGVQTLLTKLGILNDTTATATVAVETQTVATEELSTVQGVQAVDLDALTASYTAETVAEGADTVATEGLTAATGALDVAMDANPIGLVIAALAALVLVVVEVWQHFDTLKSVVGDVWNFLGGIISDTYNYVIKPVFDALGAAVDFVVGAFQSGVNAIGAAWNALGDIVKAPVNFVIGTIYDNGIARLWNDIAGIFGLPQMPIVATLAEGGVLAGYAPGRDTVPALLSAGEGVLVPEAVRGLGADFVTTANSYFSGGRASSNPGKVGGVQHFADGGIAGFLTSLVTGPANAVASYFAGPTDSAKQIPGGNDTFNQALGDIPGKVVSAVTDKATSYAASLVSGGGTSGGVSVAAGAGVEQWRSTGLAALAAEGQSPDNITYLLAQMTTESGGNPTIVNTTDCLTIDAMILTKRGWLKHDEVVVGDETIGYNPETGCSEWTRITRIVHYADAPLVRLENSRWQATTTPNHRWLNVPQVYVKRSPVDDSCPLCPWPDMPSVAAPQLASCPECGWVPSKPGGVAVHRARKHGVVSPRKKGERIPAFRRRGATTERGVQIHLAKVHGVTSLPEVRKYADKPSFITTEDITGAARLMLAAPAQTTSTLDITTLEAALLGWIAGDGHVERQCPTPSECAMLKRRDDGTCRTHKARQNPSVSIAQSKPAMVERLQGLLADVPHKEYVVKQKRERAAKSCGVPHVFRLDYRWAQDLLRRAGNPKVDAVNQVLSMSTEQRSAWLNAIIDAEGHRRFDNGPDNKETISISQVYGTVFDAIKLAVYLEGYRPRIIDRSKHCTAAGWTPSGQIAMNVPYLCASYLRKVDAGRGEVWCVTTELGTWTAEENGHVFLTGNSNWAAGTPSVGLLQVIGPTYATYKDPRFDTGPYEYGVSVNPMANITAAIKYTLSAYGSLASVWGQGHGYDEGGWLPPGLTVAYNATRSPEAVLTGAQWSSLLDRAQNPAGGQPVTVNVYPRAEHSEAEIADRVSRQLSIAMRTHR